MVETSSAEERALRDVGKYGLLGDLRGEECDEFIRRGGIESEAVCTASKMWAGISISLDEDQSALLAIVE